MCEVSEVSIDDGLLIFAFSLAYLAVLVNLEACAMVHAEILCYRQIFGQLIIVVEKVFHSASGGDLSLREF